MTDLDTPSSPGPRDALKVAGRLEITLEMFEQRCLTEIEHMQTLIAPDNALIALLCDAVRMKREYVEALTTLPRPRRAPEGETAVSGAPEALNEKFQTGPLLLDAIRASIAHLDFLTPVQRALILDNASCAVRSAVITEILKVEQLAASFVPLREAEHHNEIVMNDLDSRVFYATTGVESLVASARHWKAKAEAHEAQLAKARAALFRLTSFPHACDSYFGEGADECVPCIAQRALDEAQKD